MTQVTLCLGQRQGTLAPCPLAWLLPDPPPNLPGWALPAERGHDVRRVQGLTFSRLPMGQGSCRHEGRAPRSQTPHQPSPSPACRGHSYRAHRQLHSTLSPFSSFSSTQPGPAPPPGDSHGLHHAVPTYTPARPFPTHWRQNASTAPSFPGSEHSGASLCSWTRSPPSRTGVTGPPGPLPPPLGWVDVSSSFRLFCLNLPAPRTISDHRFPV